MKTLLLGNNDGLYTLFSFEKELFQENNFARCLLKLTKPQALSRHYF